MTPCTVNINNISTGTKQMFDLSEICIMIIIKYFISSYTVTRLCCDCSVTFINKSLKFLSFFIFFLYRGAYLYLKTLSYIKKCHLKNQTVVDLFGNCVKKHPDRVCFVLDDDEWTYRKVMENSFRQNKVLIILGFIHL